MISENHFEKDKIHRDILGPAPAKKVEVGARMDQGSYDDDIYSIKREMELVLKIFVLSCHHSCSSFSWRVMMKKERVKRRNRN